MASGDATPFPIKNQAYRVTFPIFDADGDLVSGAAGLDSEVSKDGGTFADCTNEATEIATASGMYYLDLTATEMNADTVAIIVKTSTSGAKTTPIVMYPAEDTDIPVNVKAISDDTTAPGNLELMYDGTGYAGGTTKLDVDVVSMSDGVITAAKIAVDAIGASEIADGAIDAGAIATGAIDADAIAADAITAAKIAANAIGASEVADGAIDAATFAADAINAAAIAADAITSSELAASAAQEIADAFLDRDMSAAPETNARSPLNALRHLRNKWAIVAGVLTVRKEDDTTAAWTADVTANASADPVVEVDPT